MYCRALRILALSVLTSAWFAPHSAVGGDTLRILAWPGYADEDLVKHFERQSGARVEVTFIGSDDALWEKISEPDVRGFDVFAVNTAELQRYIDAALVRPLDPDAIPNLQRQLPQFRNRERIPGIVRDGRLFAVPYAYAEMGLIYDRRAVTPPPDSISVLWDPRFRGRVLAYDGGTHNFSIAAMRLGIASPFRYESSGDWARGIEQLIALRRNVLTFYSLPEESVELFRDNQVSVLFANYGRQQLQLLRASGADVGYVIPREGALAWLDCWAVTAGGRNPRLAAAWINFTLEPEVSHALTSRHGLNNTLEQSDNGDRDGRLVWLEPVENSTRRADLWHRIASGDRSIEVKDR